VRTLVGGLPLFKNWRGITRLQGALQELDAVYNKGRLEVVSANYYLKISVFVLCFLALRRRAFMSLIFEQLSQQQGKLCLPPGSKIEVDLRGWFDAVESHVAAYRR